MSSRYVYLIIDTRDTTMVSGPAYDGTMAAIEAAIAEADEQSRLDAERYFTPAATHAAYVAQDDSESDVLAIIIDPANPFAPPKSVVKRFAIQESPKPSCRCTNCSRRCPEPSEENVGALGDWLYEQIRRDRDESRH